MNYADMHFMMFHACKLYDMSCASVCAYQSVYLWSSCLKHCMPGQATLEHGHQVAGVKTKFDELGLENLTVGIDS